MSNPSAISTSDLERIRACDHVVLFHDDADGYGSAAALMSAFPELMFAPVVVNYHYPSTFELFDGPALTDKHVYIVDFSAPGSKDGALARIEALHAKAASLQVIDHHPVTEGMTHLPYVHYTPGVAGCKATWEFYHNGEPLPDLLRYIAMYDLWEHYAVSEAERVICEAVQLALENTDCLKNRTGTWPEWNYLLTDISGLLANGRPLLQYRDTLIAELCNPKNKNVVMRDVCGHRVPTVISPNWPNEIAHWLLVGFPEAPFVMVGKHIEQGTAIVKWSVRARAAEFDTREISNRFCGGGRKEASGFTVICPLEFTKGAK
jgi:hypothetical protein